jgi:hypothetical protein
VTIVVSLDRVRVNQKLRAREQSCGSARLSSVPARPWQGQGFEVVHLKGHHLAVGGDGEVALADHLISGLEFSSQVLLVLTHSREKGMEEHRDGGDAEPT